MSRKRILTIFLVLTLVVLAAAGSWLAGSSIQSPAEAAARTAPPEPAPILVPVEERLLTSNIVTRGTARFGLPRAISIVPSVLKPDVSVITTLPMRNMQLNEGEVMLTASGRPVFVFQGESPVYRDLVPGMSGDDVRQLEASLDRLGFDPGPIDGTYDEQTSTAVADWYVAAGWQPFGPTAEQLASLRALERTLAEATNNQLAAADIATAAPLAIEAARATAEIANKVAVAEVAAKTAILDEITANSASTDAERMNARADLELAEAAAKAIELEGEVAIQAALDAQKAVKREAKLAENLVAQITADLETVQRNTGVQVPADEIIFIPNMPVRVEQINVVVGDAAGGPVIKVTNNQLAIDSSLPLDEALLVKPGMTVAIDEPDLGIKATGVVARVATTSGTDGADGYHIYFETLVDETAVELEGFSLRLTIPVESTGGAVLVVPINALSLATDGTSRVQMENNGSLEYIIVEPGLTANGFVEVMPLEDTLEPGQLVVIGFE